MSDGTGTRVTVTDIDSGDSESTVIKDNYVVICDGDRYVSNVQVHPTTGTAVITIRRREATA